MKHRIGFAVGGAVCLTILLVLFGRSIYTWAVPLPEGIEAQYVGSQACAECHEFFMKRWSLSYHAESMNHATEKSVLGSFDGQKLSHSGETSEFFKEDGKFWVDVNSSDGKTNRYEIKYVLGVFPLQEYLVEIADGKVQCLPWAWDVAGKKWYHLYADDAQTSTEGDVLHWRQPAQNWNYMCASCHVTNLKRNFDFASKTYHTTFTDINNGCESCHGPGSVHIQIAQRNDGKRAYDRRYGCGLFTFRNASGRTSTDACAGCHARKLEIYPDWTPGGKFCDYYYPELLDSDAFYPDGQIKEEDFEYTSFLQSKFYAQGGSCVDCHDAFIARIPANQQDGFQPKPVSQMCARCHDDAKYNSPSHHFHTAGANTPGTRCEDCHMPSVTYMALDKRRDHSMSVPRPQLTVDLGVPNACSACHNDASKGESPQWAQSKIDQWYGKQDYSRHFAYAIAAGRRGRDNQEASKIAKTQQRLAELVKKDSSGEFVPDIVRASAAALLANFDGASVKNALFAGLKDESELVRTASARALEYKFQDDKERQSRLEPLLEDPVRSVRMEAARQLSKVFVYDKAKNRPFDKAMAEYIRSQENLNDQSASHLNLGVLEENWGRFSEAVKRYEQSLELDKAFYPGRNNLAMVLYRQGKKAEAEKEFKTLTQTHPNDAQAWYSLGLLVAEDPSRLKEAIPYLEKAVELNPNSEHMRHNLKQVRKAVGNRQ